MGSRGKTTSDRAIDTCIRVLRSSYGNILKILFISSRAQDRTSFSTTHLNHADKASEECNVVRLLEDDRVAFFTFRDIVADEELAFDYGSNFWKGRKDKKM